VSKYVRVVGVLHEWLRVKGVYVCVCVYMCARVCVRAQVRQRERKKECVSLSSWRHRSIYIYNEIKTSLRVYLREYVCSPSKASFTSIQSSFECIWGSFAEI